ncbi:hypothetical protein ACQ4PT_054703 [Festuca glaucescens]
MLSSSASRRDAAATATAAAAAAAASSTTSSTTAKTADQPLPTKTFAQRAGDALAAAASRSGELTKNATMAVSRSGELTKNATMAAVREAAAASTTKADALAAVREAAANAVQHEGWMVRYGRRKIGRSFFHTRYFVLESKLLAYYKKKPKDSVMIYVLCVYNKKEKEHQITMGAYDIEDALAWKKKIEQIIDQQQDTMTAKNRKAFASMDFDAELGGQFSFSDHDSAAEDEEERPTLTRRTTIGNGPPESIHDWTNEPDIGLRIFEELLEVDYLARSCSRAMRAVGVVEATCEAIFGLVMSMDVTRYEWDCSFRYGSLVEEVDGHTAILYHKLQLHWCPMFVWPRDLCYVRYWRRNDDGSYGLREYFSQTDECHITPRIPVMENMVDPSMPKDQRRQEIEAKIKAAHGGQKDNKSMSIIDEESDEDEDYQVPEANIEIPAPSYLMELAAIDWFKDTKRMDNVGRQKGCVAQVAAEKGMHTFVANIQIPGSTHYSIVMYFVTSTLKKGSLLQRFFDGDDEFRNSRLKLIPAVPKGSWIVRQSVGSTPCLLGKAVDCSYVRASGYLEVDVDIGSSAVANGVLGLVFGVVTTLVVDMAFLIQANTYDELPEQVIGAARLAHVEPAAAIVPDLDNNNDSKDSGNDDNNNNTSSEDDSSKKTN